MNVPHEALPQISKVRALLGGASVSGEIEARSLLECCAFLDSMIAVLAHERRAAETPQAAVPAQPVDGPRRRKIPA